MEENILRELVCLVLSGASGEPNKLSTKITIVICTVDLSGSYWRAVWSDSKREREIKK